MELDSEEVKIGKLTYTVSELPFEQITDVLEAEGINVGLTLVKKCVTLAGDPIGDNVSKMGAGKVLKLIKAANRLNGFADDDEGKS